jgi:DNA polymerase-4
LAWNLDARPVEPERVVKSIGHEETFARDIVDRPVLEHEIVRLSDKVGARLRAAGRVSRTVQLKIRYADFRTITRSRTFAEATDVALEIARSCVELLHDVELGTGIRLLGVSAQQLEPAAAVQAALPFEDGATAGPAHEQRRRVERSVDEVRERYGDDSVIPARFAPQHPARPPSSQA